MKVVIYCRRSDREHFDFGVLQKAGIKFKVYDASQAPRQGAMADASVVVVPFDHPALQAVVNRRQPSIPIMLADFSESGAGVLAEQLKDVAVDAGLGDMSVKELNALISDEGLDVDMSLKKAEKIEAIERARE